MAQYRRHLEEFRKKRSLDAPESADGRPDRRLQDPAPIKPPRSRNTAASDTHLLKSFLPIRMDQQPVLER